MRKPDYTETERRLLNEWQRDLPLVPRPYAAIGQALGLEEAEVIEILAELREQGAVSRVGAVVRPNVAGASTLAAMAVPDERLDEVAHLVSSHEEVNHNYEREHALNLWFVVTAESRDRVAAMLAAIEDETGLPVIDLPLAAEYRIDLGFDLKWT